jgi:predicted nucleic acid-binding protein
LLVEEEGSEQAGVLWDEAARRFSTRLLPIEAEAALARARRASRLTPKRLAEARRILGILAMEMFFVEVSPAVVRLASDLVHRSSLRAFDAVHLASALTVAGPDLVFATWDTTLRRTARETGLSVS